MKNGHYPKVRSVKNKMEQTKMNYLIHELHRRGFNLSKLPKDILDASNIVLNQKPSDYNAQVEMLDITTFNSIKAIYPTDKIVVKVYQMYPKDKNSTFNNNGFNTPVLNEN